MSSPEEVVANKALRLKSREQGILAHGELRDWDGWELAKLREDKRPFSTDGDD